MGHSRSRSKGSKKDSKKHKSHHYNNHNRKSRSRSSHKKERRNSNEKNERTVQSQRKSRFTDNIESSQANNNNNVQNRNNQFFENSQNHEYVNLNDLIQDKNKNNYYNQKLGDNKNINTFQYTNVREQNLNQQEENNSRQQGNRKFTYERPNNDNQPLRNSIGYHHEGNQEIYSNGKFSKKMYLPLNSKVNYIGIILGQKGQILKQLKEETGCKIQLKGKGCVQKEGIPPSIDDNDDLHLSIFGDSEEQVNKAQKHIENTLQLEENKQQKHNGNSHRYGNDSYNNQENDKIHYIPISKDIIGLVIGKQGETIRQIKEKSGASKLYLQQDQNGQRSDEQSKNLVAEGTPEQIQRIKDQIEEIKNQQKKIKQPQNSIQKAEIEIPNNLVGLVIGKQGSNLKQICQQTNTRAQISQDQGGDDRRKMLQITGYNERDVQQAKELFSELIHKQNENINKKQNNRRNKNIEDDDGIEQVQYYNYQTYQLEDQLFQQQQQILFAQLQQQQPQQPQQPQQSQQNQQTSQTQQPQQNQQPQQQQQTENQNQDIDNSNNNNQDINIQNQEQQLLMQQYIQYQQYLLSQQNYNGPIIEEVLEDGTIVSVSDNKQQSNKERRGGRR